MKVGDEHAQKFIGQLKTPASFRANIADNIKRKKPDAELSLADVYPINDSDKSASTTAPN